MGIYLLNTFLKTECSNVFDKKQFIQLKNKRVAIDTSIYMYLFSHDNKLIENFYDLCTIFLIHNIKPLFIFDGKPGDDKKDELLIRKEKRKKAEKEYTELINYLESIDDVKERNVYENKLNYLKNKCIRIINKDITMIKELITSFGMEYIDAPGESDSLCSYLCIHNVVDACISEDTDMFVYGCPKIFRGLDLKKNTVDVFSIKDIINNLGIDFYTFQMICLLCDNDYYKTGNNMFSIYKKYKKYIENTKINDNTKNTKINNNTKISNKNIENNVFLQFIKENQKKENIDDYLNIYDKYNIFNYHELYSKYKNMEIKTTNYDIDKIQTIIKQSNIYFVS